MPSSTLDTPKARHQHRHRPRPDDMKRFLDKIDKQPNGCWIWTGYKYPSGYGLFYAYGKKVLAHRFSYEINRGPIPPWTPKGYQLDHAICDTKSCVNPDHLRLVLQRENALRSNSPPAKYAKSSHCKHGHEFIPENLYKNTGKRKCRICALRYLHQDHVRLRKAEYDRDYRRKKAATSPTQ